MSKIKDTLEKAYGSVAKEPVINIDMDLDMFRSIRYYWVKIYRKILRR